MGQIVIDIPTNAKRRYVLSDKKRTAELLVSLEESAVRVKINSLSPKEIEELEYQEDVRDIEKAMAEYRRTGKTYKWEEIKAELGL
jgi:hypothetical protein